MTPDEFITKWGGSHLTERSAAQQHFLDLCELLGVPKPADVDTVGDYYTFEKVTAKESGKVGFADVWYKQRFAWEYKGPNKNLDEALVQLRKYIGALENPPLLVVSDMQRIRVITQFTNYVTITKEITITDLRDALTLSWLRNIWLNPEALKPTQTRDAVTDEAASQFATIADRLRTKDQIEPQTVAHFLIRVLFCLFAENNGLLPKKHFTTMLELFHKTPEGFTRRVADIFARMATGGFDGNTEIRYFNGDLFTDAQERLIKLHPSDLAVLWHATAHDWSSVAPAIFGTLFERGLDPTKRSQIGAHYTSEADIMDVVEPVVMAPLRRQWHETRTRLEAQVAQNRLKSAEATKLLGETIYAISQTTVLDPACGSGNFLYVTLKLLHELEFEIITWHIRNNLPAPFPTVGPHQLHGIEINTYAAELARAVIWIGHLQWMIEHGFDRGDPVLDKLENIVNKDALIDGATGTIATWPKVTCIVSNPPFLGARKLRNELGNDYVDILFHAFSLITGHDSDLVSYFVDRARVQLENGDVNRIGLITTNSIRGGSNRAALDKIKTAKCVVNNTMHVADIFMAWSDREWVLDGASVRISIIGFDNGDESVKLLNGHRVETINPDLTTGINLTLAKPLIENGDMCFQGTSKGGPFDIDVDKAEQMLRDKGNPNGLSNHTVVKNWINSLDITRRPRNKWIIDFGVDTSFQDAALFEMPFEYVKQHVYPQRMNNNVLHRRNMWWIHAAPAMNMRRVIGGLERYIVTPTVAKYRIFAWVKSNILPDHQLIVIAKDDDYTFGVLHSHAHELWSLRMCTWLGVGNDPRYTPTTCFETFPFPRASAEQQAAIATAALQLVTLRDNWLNPPAATEIELKKRTLTALYNANPQWLQNAHATLNLAVYTAYGWPATISDDAMLTALLAENLARAGKTVVDADNEADASDELEPDKTDGDE